MKIGISIYGSGHNIPSHLFPAYGPGYGKEVRGTALGWSGTHVQFLPDDYPYVITLPTTYDWISIHTDEKPTEFQKWAADVLTKTLTQIIKEENLDKRGQPHPREGTIS